MSGQRPELMHCALNEAARRVLDGFRFDPGTTAENVIGRFPVVADAMTREGVERTALWSGWFHRREVDAMQLVWPDTRGIFAWQPGASPYASSLQPHSWRVQVPRVGPLAPDPDWPFPVPADRMVFSCACVVDEGAPIRLVERSRDDENGEDWQLLCGEEHEDMREALRLLHFSHLVRGAPSICELNDLGLDERAERKTPWSPWIRGLDLLEG